MPPDTAESLLEQARALRKAGRLDESATALRRAVALAPMNPDLWFQGGTLALRLREPDLARRLFEMCVLVQPGDATARYNVGFCDFRLGRLEAARASYEEAVRLDPSFVRARIASGQLAYILGDPAAGARAFDEALALPPPDKPVDRELRALTRIVRGDFAGGWEEFDASWGAARPDRLEGRRQWSGTPDPDATVCLTVDGGFGDTILFARFARQVRARVGRVVAALEPALAPLLRHVDGIDALVERDDDLPRDAQLAGLWTLPRKLRTTPLDIPGGTGYVPTPPEGPALGGDRRPRIGLAWAGGRDCLHDVDRSCHDLRQLAPMLQLPGIDWIVLQPESDVDALGALLPADARARPMPPVRHFGDTAHVIAQLDLVIAVDTAVANLAAAMGVPTWILVPTIPEFRWPIGTERSPWYPQARLFRRAHTREWDGCAQRVATALRDRLAQGRDPDLPGYSRLEPRA